MDTCNPYRTSIATPSGVALQSKPQSLSAGQATLTLMASYLATTAAGAMFGIIGGIIGIFFGALLAGASGMLVFSLTIALNYLARLSNHVVFLATMSGGLTGCLSVIALGGGMTDVLDPKLVLLYGITAVLGASAAGGIAWTITLMFHRRNQQTDMSDVLQS